MQRQQNEIFYFFLPTDRQGNNKCTKIKAPVTLLSIWKTSTNHCRCKFIVYLSLLQTGVLNFSAVGQQATWAKLNFFTFFEKSPSRTR